MKTRTVPLACLTFVAAWLLANLLGGCSFGPQPVAPVTPDTQEECAAATDNLARLGGCGADLDRFTADCVAASKAEAEPDVNVDFPAQCIRDAQSCDAAARCR